MGFLPKELIIKDLKIPKKPSAKRNTQNDNDSCDHKKKKQEPEAQPKQEAKLKSEFEVEQEAVVTQGETGNGV